MKLGTVAIHRICQYLYIGLAFLLWENAIGSLLGDYHFEIRRTLWGIVFYGALFLLFGGLTELLNYLYSRLHPRSLWFGQRYVWFLAILVMFLWSQIARHAFLDRFPKPGLVVLNLDKLLWIALWLAIGWIANLTLASLARRGRIRQTPTTTLIFHSSLLYLMISLKVGYHYFQFRLPSPDMLLFQPFFMMASALVMWLVIHVAKSPVRLRTVLLLIPILLALVITKGNFKNCAHSQSASVQQSRPNIIIMLFDALRADHVGAMGYSPSLTPHMDALARNGKAYPDCYSSSSWTNPAVVGLLTSRNAGALGLLQRRPMPDSLLTVAQILRQSGYYTACISANPVVSPSYGYDRGFDDFEVLRGTGPMQLFTPMDLFLWHQSPSTMFNTILMELTYQMGFLSTEVRTGDWHTVNKAAEEEMARSHAQPFFLYLHYYEPHSPYDTKPFRGGILDLKDVQLTGLLTDRPAPRTQWLRPPSGEEHNELRKMQHDRYLDGVRTADRAVAKMQRILRKRGLLDNTVIIILSDHGEEFLDHGRWGHGSTLYQELVRIPLIVHIPPALEIALPDQSADVSILDIAPTILDLAGAGTLPGAEGHSLLQPHLEKRTLSVMTETPVALWSAVLADPYKLILQQDRNIGQVDTLLFNLAEDPAERINLYPKWRSLTDSLAVVAKDLLDQAAAAAPSSKRALPHELDQRLRALGYVF